MDRRTLFARNVFGSWALALGASSCGSAGSASSAVNAVPSPTPLSRGASTISAVDIRRDLSAFADDSMLGRDAATGDAVRAARFLAAHAAAVGLEPAGDSGSFLQRVPLVREYLGSDSRVALTLPGGAAMIALGPQLLPVLTLGEEMPLPKLDAEGDLVFAGYGYPVPGMRDDLAGQSVAGHVAVFVMDEPPGLDSAARSAVQREWPLPRRVAELAERGPSAIVVVVSGPIAGMMPAIAAEMRDSSPHLDEEDVQRQRTLPMVLLCDVRGAASFLPKGWPSKPVARGLADRHLSAHVDWIRSVVPAYNVVGMVRGSDSALRSTYVAFGAHLDHIGIQHGATGDSINNGADDDGSGSVALLAIARAAATQRPVPRRSMLFVWHTGEELGLYGSEWFTTHPTVPRDSIVAQLNADMVGRNGAESLYIVGPRAAPHRQSFTLGAIADSVNSALKPPFKIDREWDSPTHPEQIYYRSDHYNYAKRGIPVLFFTSGLHKDYHQPSDEVSKIDFAKLARVADFIFEVGLAVADRPTRPFPLPPPNAR